MIQEKITVSSVKVGHANHDQAHKQNLIIIGAGMAGTRFAFELAKAAPSQNGDFAITLLGSEPHAGYNRIMLSPVLAGEKAFEDIALYPKADYDIRDITLKTGCTIANIDTDSKYIATDTGEHLHYDKLVFATGSNPFIIPLPNHDAAGVLAFRTKADVDAMLAIATQRKPDDTPAQCVVIGGGLLGLEAANALSNHGAQVTVVHIGEHILDRQLDAAAAQLLQDHFERQDIRFLLQAFSDTINVDDNHHVTGLTFKDGTQIPADAIIMTVGVRPNIALAEAAGIPCEKGILVDSHMQTQVKDIYAIGECVQFEGNLFGLVAPVYEQASILVNTLVGTPEHYRVKSTATKLKVSGVDLFSAGDIVPKLGQEHLIYHDPAQRIYQKLTLEDDKLVAAVLYGDVLDGAWFFELIQNQTDISDVRDELLFGRAFCEDVLKNGEVVAVA